MITTVLMDYDGTLHDWDTTIIQSLNGILDLSGNELYNIWRYKIHRAIVHTRHLDRHDDILFHAQLLFKHLNRPYDEKTSTLILQKFAEASRRARETPNYFPDAVPTLDRLKSAGLMLCLSTGHDAKQKAKTLEKTVGVKLFHHIFSEPMLGYLKTELEYYYKALEITRSLPRETVSVGDTPPSDIRPAKLLGIKTIWLNRNNQPKPITEDQLADHEAQSLTEAADLILDY